MRAPIYLALASLAGYVAWRALTRRREDPYTAERFFEGQYLGTDDFEQEQSYSSERSQRHGAVPPEEPVE